MTISKRVFTKEERDIVKNSLNLLIQSQRRQINTSTSSRMRLASEEALAETQALLNNFSNLDLDL